MAPPVLRLDRQHLSYDACLEVTTYRATPANTDFLPSAHLPPRGGALGSVVGASALERLSKAEVTSSLTMETKE